MADDNKPEPTPFPVEATVNGEHLPRETFRAAGKHVYSGHIAPAPRRCEIQIRLSHTFPEPPDSDRDLGVIVRLPRSTIIAEDCGFQLYS